MRVNRLLAAALAAATLAGTAPALQPPAAAAQPSSFTDLSAPKQAEAAEFLKLLGVVNGVPGGAYNPSGTLSRAEFCKMAVSALDRADEELAQRGRTIYFDVGPTHWARGYINLASTITLGSDSDGKGGTALVAGAGDGNFYPDQPITYGAAVAILCRMLGYGVNDVATGGAWYDGYLATGAANGLTEGIYLSGGEAQRLAIARAMLKNAPVLILDEATAFADPDNETKVQAAFNELAKGRTVIMIAHRLSTIVNADRIFVLNEGQLSESGSFAELSGKKDSLFGTMWRDYQQSVRWKVEKEA